MWIETGGTALTGTWLQSLGALAITSQDSVATEWFELNTGSSIVLVSSGPGWREPENSRFQVFHRSPSGQISDLTFAMLGGTRTSGKYDTQTRQMESYKAVKAEAQKAISDALNSTQLYGAGPKS